MEVVAKITLDADTFRALASSTRLTVLKSLDERRKTLTELSRDLALNKATVHEHMALLTAAGLVRKRDDEGRKWIYYELTWTGQRILHPEATTTFNLLLALSVAAAGGGVAMLGRAMGWWLEDTIAGRQSDGAEGADQAYDDLAISSQPESQPMAASDSDTTYSDSGGSSAAQSSTATGTSSASSQTAAGAPAAPEGADGENELRLVEDGSVDSADDSSGPLFFDDGGWIAIALLVTCALFLGLAFVLQRKFVSRPLDETSAAAAEQGPGGPAGPKPPNAP